MYLEAVMWWPRASHEHHSRFVAAMCNESVRNALKLGAGHKASPDALELVVEAARGPSLRDLATDPAYAGVLSPAHRVMRRDVAGRLLLFVLACVEANDPGEPATLENARNAISSAGGKYTAYPGLSRAELIAIWKDHAPAAHLIAARYCFGNCWDEAARKTPSALLSAFLATAETIRLRGEQHRAPRSKTALLDTTETWRMPDWLILPQLPSGSPLLPSPARLRAEMGLWPHPREVSSRGDMSPRQ